MLRRTGSSSTMRMVSEPPAIGAAAAVSSSAKSGTYRWREETIKGAAFAGFAVHFHPAFVLFDNAITVAKPRPVPLPMSFVVKTVRRCGPACGIHADTVVRDAQANKPTFVRLGWVSMKAASMATVSMPMVSRPPRAWHHGR